VDEVDSVLEDRGVEVDSVPFGARTEVDTVLADEDIEAPAVFFDDAPGEARVLSRVHVGRGRRNAAPTQFRRLGFAVAVTDVLSLGAASFLAYWIMFGSHSPSGPILALGAFAVPIWLTIFTARHLYDLGRVSPSDEFRELLLAITLAAAAVVTVAFWVQTSVPRGLIGLTWVISTVLCMTSRRLWHLYIWRRRKLGDFRLRTLLIGANAEAERLVQWMRSPESNFEPVGALAMDTDDLDADLPILGMATDLARVIRSEDIDSVFVASSAVPHHFMPMILRAARHAGTTIWVSANLRDVLAARVAPRTLDGTLALSVQPVRFSGWQELFKRSLDLVVATVALIVFLPMALAVAAAVKLTSRGPVLFKQTRVTKGGRAFTMYKFRTMVDGADKLTTVEGLDLTATYFKLARDPRLTSVGRFLRRTSLDELPQLWNVIRGQMSLVGPRPLLEEQVSFSETYMEALEARHEVRAGLTGWWQINGRSEVDPDAALRMDVFYVENWSIGLDLFILVKTIGAIVRGKGAW
jgi:exopolysaccharide biosynthesis polyprenyl glycosylphosphotransferase